MADGPSVDKAQEDGSGMAVFLSSFSLPAATPILAIPTPPPNATTSLVPPIPTTPTAPRHSSRLAAKPTSSLSTMDKVIHVLLKKSGLKEDSVPAPRDDRQKYELIYKNRLPPSFLEAVSSLTDLAGARKKKKQTPARATAVAAA